MTLSKRISLRFSSLGFVGLAASLSLLAVTAAGCDDGPDPAVKESCTKIAEHMAGVVIGAGEAKAEAKKEAVEAGVEACVAEPPSEEQTKCVLAATTAEAIKACDDEDEDEKKD